MALNPNYPKVELVNAETAYLALHVGFTDTAALASRVPIVESTGFVGTVAVSNTVRYAEFNPLGGEDRGMCQINSAAHPLIPEVDCYDPLKAMRWMYSLTVSGTDFGAYNYGPNAYGPKIPPPLGPRPARTDTQMGLALGVAAVAAPLNPYWKLFDAGYTVLGLPKPSGTPYVSTLPPPPLRFGNSGPAVAQLQRELASEGFWTGSHDSYYGPRVKTGVIAVKQMLTGMGLFTGVVVDGYTIALHDCWDGAREYAHRRSGR